MDRKERILEVKEKIVECRKELEQLRGEISSFELQKVKASLSSSISFLNKASKQLSEVRQVEGQMDIFDYMTEDGDFDLD